MSTGETLPNVNPSNILNSLTEANESEYNADKISYASGNNHSLPLTTESPTTSILTQRNTKLRKRQDSEESRARSHRSLHPAMRRAAGAPKQQMFMLPNELSKKSGSYKRGPQAFNTLRRISKADFSSVRRAGK